MNYEHPLSYIIIEDSLLNSKSIAAHMSPFEGWHLAGSFDHVNTAMNAISSIRPALLFLDWNLKGGSAYDILQHIRNLDDYRPYIIFNTGWQSDFPDIPQEIINKYQVDKYLVKPIFENLRHNLAAYLKEAAEKQYISYGSTDKKYWLRDANGEMLLADMSQLMYIIQDGANSRCRIFCFNAEPRRVTVSMTWQQCTELIDKFGLDYFIAKHRSHILVRGFIDSFKSPYARLKGAAGKFEIVKESIGNFEVWLQERVSTVH